VNDALLKDPFGESFLPFTEESEIKDPKTNIKEDLIALLNTASPLRERAANCDVVRWLVGAPDFSDRAEYCGPPGIRH